MQVSCGEYLYCRVMNISKVCVNRSFRCLHYIAAVHILGSVEYEQLMYWSGWLGGRGALDSEGS